MRYWFDTQSGTFGDARHLVVAEVEDNAIEDVECMSDRDRIAYAKELRREQPVEFTFLTCLPFRRGKQVGGQSRKLRE